MAELYHHGVKGQQWGVRRYQKKDGSLTPSGKKRYTSKAEREMLEKQKEKNINMAGSIIGSVASKFATTALTAGIAAALPVSALPAAVITVGTTVVATLVSANVKDISVDIIKKGEQTARHVIKV